MSDETPTIPPALSREAWADVIAPGGAFLLDPDFPDDLTDFDGWFEAAHGARPQATRHALAALCLHEQPYGFTREDVAALRFVARAATITRSGPPLIPDAGSLARVEAVAARLAALLPPEG